ncbi:major facilitator superfamily domain-containing protein [Mycena alexandri]|uniref:Major facilitator superfamily domain-containing protein n=1 Tax=Mycena alexandri TaxID=1745969 RepID=A0AAD6TEE7_9AGAR|nr:major facilitator superfamily domain-containing protein [Mycena alexandri]
MTANDPAKKGESPESPNSDSESLDLAGDLDLEAQLNLDGSELEGNEKYPAPAHRPATLAPDDPENPKNWSFVKRATVNSVLCVWVLTLTYASTAYVSSLPDLIRHYNMSKEAFAFGAAFAPNAASLLIFRFFIGFFGAAAINNVPASIGDYTTLRERGQYSILYALMAFGGPSLGPLASAFIQHDAGYHWNFRVMAIFCTVMSILVAFVPETHGPTLLKWKNKKQGKAPPPLKFGKVMTVFRIAIARPMIYLFTEPVVMLISIYLSTLYGILYGFFEAFGVVYMEVRGFKTTSYGLTYIGLGLGFFFACFLMFTYGQNQYIKSAEAAKAKGVPTAPEARLILAYLGAILSPISLFIFAWTAPFPHVHWIAPVIAQFLFACSMLLIFTGFIPYLIDCYQMTAASALAAGMCSRALVGSVFPLFTIQMYHTLTVQGATSLLAGIACLLAPIPFVFRVYGARMRERSKHAAA